MIALEERDDSAEESEMIISVRKRESKTSPD